MKIKLILSFLLFSCLTSCIKVMSPQDSQTQHDNRIPIKIATKPWSKVTDATYENGDKVGIYIVNYKDGQPGALALNGNHLDNCAYTFNGTDWVTETENFWKDERTPADFYCYYPHSASISDIHAVPVAVQKDQSLLENYKASEFMYGQTLNAKPSEQAVSIITKHAMSNVIITLKPGKGFTEETLFAEDISVTITGVQTEGTIDLANGGITATGAASDIIPLKENGYWRALVIPQDIIGTQILKVTVGKYSYFLNQNVSFQSNHQHKCTLTINKVTDGVNIGIGGWESDGQDFGGVLE